MRLKTLVLAVFFALHVCVAAADMQADRKQFMGKLVSVGVLQKIVISGDYVHAYVKPAFYSLDFDDKEKFINVIYAYAITANPKTAMVILNDSRSGKKIGYYAPDVGGLKLQ